MSQITKPLTSSGPIPPTIPTSFVTQDGIAVPAANILIVNGFDSTENNANGIITKGGVVGTGTSNEVDVVITNRVTGTNQTIGASTVVVATFTPTVIGTYAFEYRVAAFNTTATEGAGYALYGAARFDGATSTLCGSADTIDNEEGTMTNADLDLTVSGAAIQLSVTGYALQTINWSAVGLYTFVGA